MIKEIIKDKFFLGLEAEDATKEDSHIINDLYDTILKYKEHCVGLAANMIGYNKKILIYLSNDNKYKIIINPTILSYSTPYKTNEGCLSLEGQRECIRYKKIKISYLDQNFKIKIKTFTDFEAEIIQHEMDHFKGIII